MTLNRFLYGYNQAASRTPPLARFGWLGPAHTVAPSRRLPRPSSSSSATEPLDQHQIHHAAFVYTVAGAPEPAAQPNRQRPNAAPTLVLRSRDRDARRLRGRGRLRLLEAPSDAETRAAASRTSTH